MSDSRLEKFIYAICSMEVSDLPVPLSRIEKLWNCLITGETPDFEPLSRNEKYLMAMLGLYELKNLPIPMSRGEKLLYKIAVGETDLSDVPGYLSRYEELLKYLIENGGISGGDFEYVLYTLNQSLSTLYSTAEKPVKSAILSGSTKYQIGEFIQDAYVPVQQFKTGYYLGYDNGILIKGGNEHKYCEDYIPIPTGVISITSKGSSYWKKLCCYDSNKNFISGVNGNERLDDLTLNIPSNAKYFRYSTNTSRGENEYINIVSDNGLLLASSNYNIPCELVSVKMPVLTTSNEDGTKTNILTTNEDVVLRGIGNVKDTLDCLTGEVVECVGETRFNGDFSWELREVGESYTTFRLAKTSISSNMVTTNSHNRPTDYVCNALNVVSSNKGAGEFECIWFSEGHVYIRLSKDKVTTVDGLKQYLNFNDITIQYLLKNEFIKTVDLTTVDQDGQPTRLKTFNDITYVKLSSEGLIPEVELEVATKISETLETLDPRQLDISDTQNELGQTIEEQTENTDATMMATTEIYEQTL